MTAIGKISKCFSIYNFLMTDNREVPSSLHLIVILPLMSPRPAWLPALLLLNDETLS